MDTGKLWKRGRALATGLARHFTGAAHAVRPRLVLNGAYSRTYTAGSPRQQIVFGSTWALRPGIAQLPRNGSMGRLLGR
jgi:hypothetical protein